MVKQKKYSRQTNIYTKIVAGFLFLTLIAIFVILHFAVAKVTIKIFSPTETKNYKSLIEMLPENSPDATGENILGKIITKELELTASVPSQSQATVAAKAGGYVTLINKSAKNQPLIKTTRLLTADNKLYRIQEGVTVPAGGEVEVWAEADQTGEQYANPAAKLTIPGLRADLQTKIYGETEGFTLAGQPVNQVTAETLSQAQDKIKIQAVTEGLAAINDLLPKNLQINDKQLFANYTTLESSTVGQTADQTTLKQKAVVYGLVFSPADLLKVTQEKLKNELDGNQKLVNFIDGSFVYNIVEIYPDENKAVIEAKIDANISSSQHLLKIDKNQLIGKTDQGIKDYLKQFNLEQADIKFFPFWVKTVPKLKDHIIIE